MDDLQKIVNVARMYYEQGLKQEDIARKVKISRASVSLILTEARRKGIVEITIKDPLEDDTELSASLAREFHLQRCLVVPTSIRETDILIDLTASRAAEVFDEETRNGDTVGIAWGRTCYAFMSTYQSKSHPQGTRVVPLIGGSNRNLKRYQLNEMVRLFAEKLKGTPTFIHAPALPVSREDFELYMGSSSMKEMLHLWKKIDVAVISVGAPPVSQEFDGSKVIPNRKKMPPASRLPVGDMCARYFDIAGPFPGCRGIPAGHRHPRGKPARHQEDHLRGGWDRKGIFPPGRAEDGPDQHPGHRRADGESGGQGAARRGGGHHREEHRESFPLKWAGPVQFFIKNLTDVMVYVRLR